MNLNDDVVQEAIRAAHEARESAYAPYSGFKMGAAVVTDKGSIVRGTLIENVSLGLSMCSERVALFNTVSTGAGRPKILVLSSPRTDGALTWPCGACLQVARELAGPELVIIATNSSETASAKLGEIAPRLPSKANPTTG
ncbi:MAG: cytidine deaminase [Gammaproteobacteria bacterium]|jgi:cytidine deaminase